jgi:hypothetical protein
MLQCEYGRRRQLDTGKQVLIVNWDSVAPETSLGDELTQGFV